MKNKQSKLIIRGFLTVLAAGAFCLAHSISAETKEAATMASPNAMKANTGAQLSSSDKDFMMDAAKGGMMEVNMGKMAEKQGKSADVKKIGRTMVTDHTKANNQLMALAKKKGVMLDKNPSMDEKMSGANFDEEYLETMAKGHEKDITAFENEAKNGSDADVKAFANKTLPVIKKHLKMVQDAQGKMGKKG